MEGNGDKLFDLHDWTLDELQPNARKSVQHGMQLEIDDGNWVCTSCHFGRSDGCLYYALTYVLSWYVFPKSLYSDPK